MRGSYDAVVVGNTLGGLLTAGILLRKKRRVLVVKTCRRESEADGYRLEHQPAVLWGLSPGRNLEKGLREMNVPIYKIKGITATDPPLQLITHKHRIDVPARREGILGMLARYHPRDSARIPAFVNQLAEAKRLAMEKLNLAPETQPKGFWGRTKRKVKNAMEKWTDSLREMAQQAGLSDEAFADLDLLQMPFTQLYHPEGRVYTAISILGHSQLDTFYFEGHRSGFLDDLLELVKELGAEVTESRIKYVFAEGQRVKAIDLEGEEGTVQARAFVWAASSLLFARIMNDTPEQGRLVSLYLMPRYVQLPLHFRAMKNILPVGIGSYLSCSLPDPPPPPGSPTRSGDGTGWEDRFILAIQPSTEQDEVSMAATAFIPADRMDLFEKEAAQTREKVLHALYSLTPFGEGKIRSVGWTESLAFAQDYLNNENVIYAWNPRHTEQSVGLTMKSRWTNFFFATQEIFPYWGLEGQALAGRLAARACLRIPIR